ncbi:MAG TPA: polysaccharide biosynthesis tyrosine autokinase [Nocardioides sp.]|nr:polysaccharide biosynthesis tyrosine autokinase [Nocardioides sp.]
MELKDYLRILRRRWISITLIALVVAGLAAAYTFTQTKQYASSVQLFVTSPPSSDSATAALSGVQTSQQSVQSFSSLVGSKDLAAEVIKSTGADITPLALSKEVKATVATQTVTIVITVKDASPARAQTLASAYAEHLVKLVSTLSTPPGSKIPTIKATVTDSASYSATPVAPKPTEDIILGLVLGLLVGVAIAVLREMLDTRVNGLADVEAATGQVVLGTIGFDSQTREKPLVTQISTHAPRAEAFRVLRTNLQFVDVDTKNKVFVVTSSVPAEGKTTTAVNLALSLAQAGVRTLLIEGDLRRPRAAVTLGFDNAVGVTSVLVGRVAFEQALQHDPTTGLAFLASGPTPPNPAELLQSHAMTDLMEKVRGQYDVVLVDAPPLLPVTDAALIAAHADGAMLVVRHGKTTRDQIRLSKDRLDHVEARLMGAVLNMVPVKNRGHGYGYGYGYGYAPVTETPSGAIVPALEVDLAAEDAATPPVIKETAAVGRRRARTKVRRGRSKGQAETAPEPVTDGSTAPAVKR